MSDASNHQGPPTGNDELQKRLDVLDGVDKKIDDMKEGVKSCVHILSVPVKVDHEELAEDILSICIKETKKQIKQIEADMSSQLDYLETICDGTPHQGSTAASTLNTQLVQDTNNMLLTELGRIGEKYSKTQSRTDEGGQL